MTQLDDTQLRQILEPPKVIAVVGHSDNPARTSYRIAQFLRQVGYRVYPVNPMVQTIDGQPSYASLSDVPASVDIVNVFRRPEFLPEIAAAAIAVHAKTLWAQLGITNFEAAQLAHNAGLAVVMDACIKVEYLRLYGTDSHGFSSLG